MTSKRFLLIALLYASLPCAAQFTLPVFDVEAKLQQTVFPGGDFAGNSVKALETTNLHLGAHVQVNQYVAVGWAYSTSLRGEGYNENDFKFKLGNGDSKASTLMYGPDVRFSTGRATKWRPYLSVNFLWTDVVEDRGSFRFAWTGTCFGASLGVMRKLGNQLYLNVIEIGVKSLSENLFWVNNGIMPEIKFGLTYNIGKKR